VTGGREPSCAPPGPRGRLVFGSLADLQRDPVSLLMSARAAHGDVVRFRYLGPRAWYFFAHPAQVEQILLTNQQEFPKGVFGRVIDLIIPRGLATAEGAEWARQRRLLQPGFSAARIEELVGTIVELADRLLEGWGAAARRGTAVDVQDDMTRLACATAGRMLAGPDFDGSLELVDRYVRAALGLIDARILHPLSPLPFLPTPTRLAYRRAARAFETLVQQIIARRRAAGGSPPGDLMSMLLESRHAETGRPLDDREICDHVTTLLISGYETTALSLTWLFYSLATNPAALARVRDEVDAVIGDRTPDAATLRRLTYGQQVINETLRLYPPTFWLGRQASRAAEIGGYRVPKGSVICVSPFVTHRHPDFWAAPDRFDPDHFAPGLPPRPRGSYFPFGLGPRHCIGQHLAILEMLIVLARVSPRWDLALDEGPRPVPQVRGTLHPSTRIRLKVNPARRPAASPDPAVPAR
jgi:cytochrome P450